MATDRQYPEEVVRFYEKLRREAEEGGYNLNPDRDFTLGLCQGLLDNVRRFGHQACPCRLALGDRAKDRDIICPCDYRDPDLDDYGTCYCALYVSDDWVAGRVPHRSIPDRRPVDFIASGYSEPGRPVQSEIDNRKSTMPLPFPVWRCKVCGYLCARAEPPGKCPVCKATKDRFERFM